MHFLTVVEKNWFSLLSFIKPFSYYEKSWLWPLRSENQHFYSMLYYVGAICFCNMSFALLEPTLPIWLLETVHAKKWQIGMKKFITSLLQYEFIVPGI